MGHLGLPGLRSAPGPMLRLGRWLSAGLLGLTVLTMAPGCSPRGGEPPLTGIVWQPDNRTLSPHGTWDRLGARQLLIQWTAVDDTAFVRGGGLPTYPILPDWRRISEAPWARETIVGLSGYFDEARARSRVSELIEQSRRLAQAPTPLRVTGWYFPVEVDPTWSEAPVLAPLLSRLPHPLWISVYDSANLGAGTLADWLSAWLPEDVGVFFQDGVGVHARDAQVARHYADVLAERLGGARVRLIVEAFRPAVGGGFRAATAEELASQIDAYRGHALYLFDGPHYVSDELVDALAKRFCPSACAER